MMRWLILLFMIFVSLTSEAGDMYVVKASMLNIREDPSSTSAVVGKLTEGEEIELLAIDDGWAKIIYRGDTCYAAAEYLSPIQKTDKSGLPAWRNPDEGKGTWGKMGYYFSTDRIMEALPDFGFLRGKLPFDPDRCFYIAFVLLLLSGITFPFFEDRIRYSNVWYWIYYIVTMVISGCELLYIFASPDPLGFCDINNVWFVTALFYFLLCGLALYQQLKLFSTILFVTQSDDDFDFKAGLSVKLIMLAVIYFMASIVVFHFGEHFPVWMNYSVIGILLLPILLMCYRAIADRNVITFVILLLFYLIAGTAIFCLYIIIGMVILVLAFVALVLSLLGDDFRMYVKKDGLWYWCDYETWMEGRSMNVWDDWTSTFDRNMVK